MGGGVFYCFCHCSAMSIEIACRKVKGLNLPCIFLPVDTVFNRKKPNNYSQSLIFWPLFLNP